MTQMLTNKEFSDMAVAAAGKIRTNVEVLTQLDCATGDGDHGISMVRAVDAMAQAVKDGADSDLKMLLHSIGWNVMCIDGGSTGPLLGSLFMGMSEGVEGNSLDSQQVAAMFDAGLAKMLKQSKAGVGDKTMMDALIPAVEAMRTAADDSGDISEIMAKAAGAAAEGAEATIQMQAKFGRARNLGERSIGHGDPGATSISYIFQGFAEALK